MRARVKVIIALSAVIIALLALGFTARRFILQTIREKVQEKITALNREGYRVRYDSMYVDWRRDVLVIDKIVLEGNPYDTTCVYPEFISADQVRVSGFRLFTYLFGGVVSFESLLVNEPRAVINRHTGLMPDPAGYPPDPFTVKIDDVRLISARVEYIDSGSCNLLTDITTDVRANSVAVEQPVNGTLLYTANDLTFSNAAASLPRVFYDLFVHEMKINFADRTIDVDTMRISPQLSKLAFGRKVGREIDRVEGIITFITLQDFNIAYPDSVAFRATHGKIQGYLKFFRDKRLVHKNIFKPLPVRHLRNLPFGLQIDTLEIEKSYAAYEEVPEDNNVSGTVFFDDLTAQITGINNDPSLNNGRTVVDASARFMGAGELRVHTVFPWRAEDQCLTEGHLKNMELPRLNAMLEPMANMKIESGNLESLVFRFAYNSIRSEGQVALKYRDLRIISFKDDEKTGQKKKRDIRKDNFRTFIINTFVIRRNMTDKLPDEKRTGEIDFNRDPSRSIFNYWWKSVFSGIRSAYNLEKKKQSPSAD